MVWFLFPPRVALDPISVELAKDVEFLVFAEDDTASLSPLPVTDPEGLPLATVHANFLGLTESFRVENHAVVVLRNGPYSIPVESTKGMQEATAAAATAAAVSAEAAQAAEAAAELAATAPTQAMVDDAVAIAVPPLVADGVAAGLSAVQAEVDATEVVANGAASAAASASAAAATAQGTADAKSTVYWAAGVPATPAGGFKAGDLRVDTADGNRVYQWSGSAWTARQFGPNSLANLAVTNPKLADSAVGTAKIADNAVTNPKIGSVDAAKVTTGTMDQARLGTAGALPPMLEAALDAAWKRPYLVTYGHSYLAETGISPASNYYARLFASQFGMIYPTNSVTDDLKRAVGGQSAEASADEMLVGQPWLPSLEMGGNKVLMIQNMLNTSRVNGVNAVTRTGAEHAIRSMVALGSCRSIIPDTATGFFTYAGSGTWGSISSAEFHGGEYRSNATDGAYVEFTVPSANCHFLTIGRKNTLSGQTLEFRDMDRNTVIRTWVNESQARSTITRNYVVAAIRLEVPAGTKVRVTKTAGSGIPLVCDGLIVPHERPGPIILVKDPYLNDYSLSVTFPNGSDAALDSFNSLYDLMATEFPNVIVVDPNTAGYWDKTTHLLPDGVHANTAGNAALHASVVKHVREKMYVKAFQSGLAL